MKIKLHECKRSNLDSFPLELYDYPIQLLNRTRFVINYSYVQDLQLLYEIRK